jgi:hypothetical protein
VSCAEGGARRLPKRASHSVSKSLRAAAACVRPRHTRCTAPAPCSLRRASARVARSPFARASSSSLVSPDFLERPPRLTLPSKLGIVCVTRHLARCCGLGASFDTT